MTTFLDSSNRNAATPNPTQSLNTLILCLINIYWRDMGNHLITLF